MSKCFHWNILIEPVIFSGHSESYVNAVTATCQECGKSARMATDWKDGARPDQVVVVEKLLAS